tara:strand:+ start:198 stop:833 length:636 start_codon:yes stop_codon:yes gene_type:complete
MIRNIVFGGCSYTWGQSLHHFNGNGSPTPEQSGATFYGDDLKYWEYQKNVNRRFSTRVGDYFCRKPIVQIENGGGTSSICEHIYKSVNEFTDLIFVQTTNFSRNHFYSPNLASVESQIQLYEDLIEYSCEKNIPIIFIHWDWPEGVEIPTSIKSQTIKIDDKYTFYHWTQDERYRVNRADHHFNLPAHKKLSKIIIKYIETHNILKKYIYE